jgi:hypothetical protein
MTLVRQRDAMISRGVSRIAMNKGKSPSENRSAMAKKANRIVLRWTEAK